MKLALGQVKRIAIAVAVAIVGFAFAAPSPAIASEVYFYKDRDGVLRFTRTIVPGAKPFRPEMFGDEPAPRGTISKPRVGHVTAHFGRTPSHAVYDEIIVAHAKRHGVDAALVKAIIHVESSFRPKARSRAGARGLMQLLPSTAGMYGVATRDLDEPQSNIRAGVRHLRELLRTFEGNVRLAVAAYNAGAGAVRRHRGLPPYRETRAYVQRVLGYYERYAGEIAL